jgi:hypothetical protein
MLNSEIHRGMTRRGRVTANTAGVLLNCSAFEKFQHIVSDTAFRGTPLIVTV